MAESAKEKAAVQAQNDEADAPDTFAVDDLIARSVDFFGQPSHVTAAALHGRVRAITLDDANAAIDSYLKQPVMKEA